MNLPEPISEISLIPKSNNFRLWSSLKIPSGIELMLLNKSWTLIASVGISGISVRPWQFQQMLPSLSGNAHTYRQDVAGVKDITKAETQDNRSTLICQIFAVAFWKHVVLIQSCECELKQVKQFIQTKFQWKLIGFGLRHNVSLQQRCKHDGLVGTRIETLEKGASNTSKISPTDWSSKLQPDRVSAWKVSMRKRWCLLCFGSVSVTPRLTQHNQQHAEVLWCSFCHLFVMTHSRNPTELDRHIVQRN